MIASIAGRLLEKAPGRVIVDVGGIGYDVQVPLSTFYVLGEAGSQVTLRVHTHVREDVIALYGFATRLEQDLFQRLIAISGIGPKLATAVLSGIEPAELVKAVRAHDVARLTLIPGVGKKTAERIGLELRDRLPSVAGAASADRAPAPGDDLRADLMSALLNLGYQKAPAEKAIDTVLKESAAPAFEHALRSVLKALMKT